MQQNSSSGKKHFIYFILVLLGIILVIAIFAIVLTRRASASEEADLEPGLSYLQSLENTDTAKIKIELKDSHNRKMREKVESIGLNNGNIWQMFSDVVIMGDSQVYSFLEFDLLDSRSVIANIGDTIEDALNYQDELQSLNPSYLVLAYGLNDVESDISVETYIEEIIEVTAQFQALLPDTAIYINSIIPSTEQGIEKLPVRANIPNWNDTVSSYCDENDIPYIDLTETLAEHPDLYEPDGVHVKKEFLQYWAISIITEIMEYELQE